MKKNNSLKRTLIMIPLLVAFISPAVAGTSYEADPVHSSVIFSISHFGVGKFYGRINNPEGKIILDEKNPPASSVEITVKALDIDTANEKRDKHLKSADFFNVEKFPLIHFKSRGVKKVSGNEYEVNGDLTFLGKTRNMSIKAKHLGSGKDAWGGQRAGFESKFLIKRSDFGMDFMMGAIGDEVDITISIEAVRK
jgi:polyisoprenoid-binding protein YceI